MKKIVVLHARHSFNYGAFMMVINFIGYFTKFNSDKSIKYFVDYSTKEDLERLRLETLGRSEIENLNITDIKIKRFHANIINVLKVRYVDQIKELLRYKPNAVVILGGDNLSEYYDGWKIINELFKIYIISKFTPVFLVGQTIGPFNSWRKKVASFCLKNCHIYFRDAISYGYARNELKLNNIFNFRDLTFLDLPRQDDEELSRGIFNKYNLEENNYIILVPSGSYKQYTDSFEDYIKSWSEIVVNLAKNEALKNNKIVLLAHVSRPDKKSDSRIIRCILENLDSEILKKIIRIDGEILASEARIILGKGLFTVSGRMHSAVSSFQMLKPAIALSYSVKYGGVIGEGLKMKDLIIEANRDFLWKDNEIVKLVEEKVNYLISNYDSICNTFKKELDGNKKLVIELIKDIVKKI